MKRKPRATYKYPKATKTIFYYSCFNQKERGKLKSELKALLAVLESAKKSVEEVIYPSSYFFIRVPNRIEELKKLLSKFPRTEVEFKKRKFVRLAFEKK